MKSYEGLFFLTPEATIEIRKNQLKNIEAILEKFKGKITQTVEWGKRVFGYPVKKHKESHVMVLDFQLDPLKLAEVRATFLLQEDILKFMITVKDTKLEQKVAQAKADAAKALKTSTHEIVPSH